MVNLRPYQEAALRDLRESIRSGKRRPILVAPTGSGKTMLAVAVIQGAINKGNRVLFLAPRRELIYQASNRMQAHGIYPGIIMAGEPRSPSAQVQVASFDTLHARGVRTERMLMPESDVLVVDEAHLAVSKTRLDILNHYKDSIIIGLTATPARGDGKGLGIIFDDLVQSVSMRQLVDQGYLAKARYFAPSKPDLEGLKVRAGDYVVKELDKRMDQPKLIGDVVDNWFRLARDRQTVVFCVTRAHSRHICSEFKSRGVRAEHLDGETPLEERKAILNRVSSGETQVLCNVFVCTFGLDIPSLSCCVLARPTKNISLYLQTAGRVLRMCEGKNDALIIDHSGAVDEHGFVDDDIPWTLEGNVKEEKVKKQKEKKEPKEITCGECGTVFKGQRDCPNCGYAMIPSSKPIPVHKASLQEIVKKKKKENRMMTLEDKVRFFGMLRYYCRAYGKKPGWAAYKYRERTGVWPNDSRIKNAKLIPPDPAMYAWIRAQNIRWAKRRTA